MDFIEKFLHFITRCSLRGAFQLTVPKEKRSYKMKKKRRRRLPYSEPSTTSFGDDHPSDLYDPSSRDSNEASSNRPLNSEIEPTATGEDNERNEKGTFPLYL